MPSYQNTKEILGSDEAAFNALVADQLTEFNDDTVTEIGSYAFYYRKNLETIYLPKLKKINGSSAFYGCNNLKRIFIGTDNSSSIVINQNNRNGFTNTGRSVIYVPDALVDQYKHNVYTNDFKHKIYGVSEYPNVEWNETEITDTPEQIAYYVSAGTAATRYNIGQYKTIDLGTEGQIRMQIVGKNMRELANSTETAQLEWLAIDLLKTEKRMNPLTVKNSDVYAEGTGSIGGMSRCELQDYLDTTIWNLLPEVWQNMIKETKVYTGIYGTNGTKVRDDLTIQKLRIPSYREMFDTTNDETQGPVYKFAFPNDETRKKCIIGASSPTTWWLRSAYGIDGFRYVNSSGGSSSIYAYSTYGVALGFST